jgi:chromosomal replication initiator protein
MNYRVFPGIEEANTHYNLMDELTRYVASSHSTTIDNVRSKSRKRENALSRQLCMWALYRCTNLTHNKIGKYYGRDHATVIHSVNEVEGMLTLKDTISVQNQAYIREIQSKFKLKPLLLIS